MCTLRTVAILEVRKPAILHRVCYSVPGLLGLRLTAGQAVSPHHWRHEARRPRSTSVTPQLRCTRWERAWLARTNTLKGGRVSCSARHPWGFRSRKAHRRHHVACARAASGGCHPVSGSSSETVSPGAGNPFDGGVATGRLEKMSSMAGRRGIDDSCRRFRRDSGQLGRTLST
jgi:hypothetical protein